MNSRSKLFFSKLLALTLALLIFQVSFFVEPVTASEEENIDDFAVHPAQRWNSISDEAVDSITGDSYEIYSLNNATTGNTEFEKSRGLRTQDMKVSSLLKVDAGGNLTDLFRDYRGDACDFNEGDIEGIYDIRNEDSYSVNEGLLEIVGTNVNYLDFYWDDIDLQGKVYSIAKISTRVSNITASVDIELWDGALKLGEFDIESTDWTTYTFTDFSSELNDLMFRVIGSSFSTIWVVDQVEFLGSFDYASHVEIGETWDWQTDNDTQDWYDLENLNVSDGFCRGELAAGVQDFFQSSTVVNISTSSFDVISVKLNVSDPTMNMQIWANLGGNKQITNSVDLSVEQTVYTFDVSENANWNSVKTATKMLIVFNEDDGNLDGDEITFIDYFLVLGNWSSNDGFALELLDNEQEEAMSFKFTRNETDNDYHDFTISLFDSSGTAFSDITSFKYDESTDGWLDLSFRLDTIEKEFRFDLKFENNTEIVDINRFSDAFTNLPVNLKLFKNANLSLCLNNTVGALSRSLVILTVLNAPFEERTWRQEDTPTDSDWTLDSFTAHYVHDDIDDTSSYRLSVPKLDSVSADLELSFSDLDNFAANDIIKYGVTVYSVDRLNGSLEHLLSAKLVVGEGGGQIAFAGMVSTDGSDYEWHDETYSYLTTSNVTIAYIDFALDENREQGIIAIWATDGIENTLLVSMENSVSDTNDNPSDEFVVEVFLSCDFDGDFETVASVNIMDIKFRESIAGLDVFNRRPPPNHVTGDKSPPNFLEQIFIEMSKFLGGIFKDAVNGLWVVLEIPLGAIVAVLGVVVTAIGQIAADTASAIWTGIVDTLSFITDAIVDVAGAVIVALTDALETIIDDIITIALTLADDLAALIMAVIDFLLVLLLTAAEAVINFVAALVFFFWDALALPDLLAIWDVVAATIIDLATGIPALLTDLVNWFFEIYIFIPIAMFAFMWLVPAINSDNIGDFFSQFFDIALKDVTGGFAFFGSHVPVPYFVVILIFMIPYGAGLIPSLGSGW